VSRAAGARLRAALDAAVRVTTPALVAATAVVGARDPRRRPACTASVAAAVAAWAATRALKPLVGRVPPPRAVGPQPSFPEGPGAVAAALAVGLRRDAPALAAAAAGLAVVDGAGQVAVGAHWPSDVLAAWALGAATAAAALSRARAASPGS
jgi:undecaprenyl-diphosphatase